MLDGQAISSSPDDAQELELTAVPSGDDHDFGADTASPGTVGDAHEGGVPHGDDADKQPAALPAAAAQSAGDLRAPSSGLHADISAMAHAHNPG